jgi:hypothetical protein
MGVYPVFCRQRIEQTIRPIAFHPAGLHPHATGSADCSQASLCTAHRYRYIDGKENKPDQAQPTQKPRCRWPEPGSGSFPGRPSRPHLREQTSDSRCACERSVCLYPRKTPLPDHQRYIAFSKRSRVIFLVRFGRGTYNCLTNTIGR